MYDEVTQYRNGCHFDDCEARFIGITRADYVNHLREAHGEFYAELWEHLVVDEQTPMGARQ